ncbi:hypothetical protein [Tuberibacillus calidus]|uniref:hypothetical protein n=1 Tax=Tuberibacillus calidus TaxID=340097 RepID=UPI000419CE83|nr:hypothetical protein [Tuberibacillus calidus]
MKIVPILGHVKYHITLDPSSWIFDDRKISVEDYDDPNFDLDEFLKAQKDERAGAALPRLAASKRKYRKEEWLTKSFVMPAKIFIQNAEPLEEATAIQFSLTNGQTATVPLEEMEEGAFQFSRDGKLLTDEGPLIFLCRGKDREPVAQIEKITVI